MASNDDPAQYAGTPPDAARPTEVRQRQRPPAPAPVAEAPTKPEKKVSGLERWMWAWPILVITSMAFFSQLAGVLGMVTAGVIVIAGLALFTSARNDGVPQQWLLPLALVACVLVGAAVIAGQFGLLSDKPAGALSSTRARDLPSAESLRTSPAPGASLVGIDLHEQNLRGARLHGASAAGASFEKAVLEDAKLAGADLRGANLQGARLSGADLRGVDFTGADLRNAVLTNTCLRGANFTGAAMNGLDASGAAVEDVVVPTGGIGTAKVWPTSASVVPTACPS
ncbi:pentapeptide repeat-containing protein [Lentzea sp. NBRC 102530]|uniref:pentapeptide repeat-containing protein n=1 Tax=Lentzea sp. NBRC 102530 TaxID=3032201 RepID=UPI0024A27D3F|nr:pentapeptide repeat-containing protein [Lentzea sp. NBRC 102530]GLY51213.1 hypothetical protein Lesp01_48690 [Lentzea sp. NBRC 102530]